MSSRKIGAIALGAALLAASGFAAGTFDVYTVDDLTNALSHVQGNSDTTIKIHPGTYYVGDLGMISGSHLACMYSGSTGVGKRRIYGLGADPSETVIVGKGMYSNSGKRVFTGDGYTMVSNVTITGGCCNSGAGGLLTAGLGVWNCIISNNYAKGAGGGTDGLSAYNCTYAFNCAQGGHGGGGRFSGYKTDNCTFATNRCLGTGNTAQGGGVSLGTHTRAKFYGNTAICGGGAHYATVIGCDFVGNRVWTTFGGAAIGSSYGSCTATNCYFRDNIVTNAYCGWSGDVANVTTFDDCKFYDHIGGCTMFTSCTFRRCEIRTLKENGTHVDMFYKCMLSNTLLADMELTLAEGSVATLAKESKFYNCTVVGYTNLSTNVRYVMQPECLAVNTIFSQTKPVGFGSDYNLVMTNCLWTEQKPLGDLPKAVGGGLVAPSALKFTDAAKGDYTLQRGSKARNAGFQDAVYPKSGAVDLNLDPRVYEGDGPEKAIIDIGCYECQIPAPGLMMLVR